MTRGTLNLGILAHVDAGKTTLTERLLYCAGVIDEPGSVDAGTTRTDSLALERERGITIKSAVVSFTVDGTSVNSIDTPGHPDFVAEVERALSVLDGVVLVVSAVEGVQPQTRILWRALQRLRIPTLFFVNKVDRLGAGEERLLADIAERLTKAIVPMGSVAGLGRREAAFVPDDGADPAAASRLAEALAEHDDAVLAAYLDDAAVTPGGWLRRKLAGQVRDGLVHPVFFGSAITGAGVDVLLHDLAWLLPAAGGDPGGPLSGRVFKVERGAGGDKVAYARLFSGTIAVRDRVRFGDGQEGDGPGSDGKVTAISVFADGAAVRRDSVRAGQIARLSGLADIRVGDVIGAVPGGAGGHHFAPPTLETAVVPRDPRDKARLHAAITQLAEQDPLINVRQDDLRQEIYVSLYGEVQKQVIEATLDADYGLRAEFRGTTPICVERPVRTGTAEEILHAPDNPFLATLAIRVDPAPAGSGIGFRLEVGHQGVPLFIYKNRENFAAAMRQYVTETLRQGLYGWQVTDCTVALTRSQYSVPDGPPTTRGPLSGPQDFRKLTPLVVMAALRRAGTVVCEPVHRFRLDTPADTLTAVLPALARLHVVPQVSATGGSWCTLEGDVTATAVHGLREQVPPLTRGDGVMESAFDRYEPVRGPAPARPRTDDNPLSRDEYLRRVVRRGP
ncbi:MAG TPA: translation factor GTPase family protein [Trebonia sp.]|nr:translation factor GTPase family protein [Trebonia sp.]